MRQFKTVVEYKEINVGRRLDRSQEVLFCITFRQVRLMKGPLLLRHRPGRPCANFDAHSHYQGHWIRWSYVLLPTTPFKAQILYLVRLMGYTACEPLYKTASPPSARYSGHFV